LCWDGGGWQQRVGRDQRVRELGRLGVEGGSILPFWCIYALLVGGA